MEGEGEGEGEEEGEGEGEREESDGGHVCVSGEGRREGVTEQVESGSLWSVQPHYLQVH